MHSLCIVELWVAINYLKIPFVVNNGTMLVWEVYVVSKTRTYVGLHT